MNNYKKHLEVGPGGINCPCCFPPKGSKQRKMEFRRAKRRYNEEVKKEIEENMGWWTKDMIEND